MEEAGARPYQYIMDLAEKDPMRAAVLLCEGLMRGDRAELRLGYSLGPAVSATLSQIPLSNRQIAWFIEQVAVPKPGIVEYGPSR